MVYSRILATFILGLALGSGAYTISAATTSTSDRDTTKDWTSCGNSTIPRECGRFKVPLDYKSPEAGTASLAIARMNATKTPRLGTLFLNPGGPGESGAALILSDLAMYFNQVSGGQYDLVSWDPRGVGDTVPKVEYFQSGAEEKAFWKESLRGGLLELRGNFSDSAEREWFYSHVNETDAALIRFGKKCNTKSQHNLKYIGTSATVRDMVALHDYLEGTPEINYWGVSYGSLIGIYFVNMFPKRVGKVIIDGILDPWLWATRPFLEIDYVLLNSTDATFNAFALECVKAGPSKCAIAQNDSTVNSIWKWTFDLIAAVYDNSTTTTDPLITSGELRASIGAAMYEPTQWASLAQTLAQLSAALHGTTASPASINNIRSIVMRSLAYASLFNRRDVGSNASDPATDYGYQAITCADAVNPGNTTTRDGFEMVVDVTQHVSSMFGPYVGWIPGGMYCHHWPSRAVERFTGPFNHKLANEILVIGNLDDPITPFISAQRIATALGDSAVLIKQNGYGHTSTAMPSNCTMATAAEYFTEGKVPPPGLICQSNDQLF